MDLRTRSSEGEGDEAVGEDTMGPIRHQTQGLCGRVLLREAGVADIETLDLRGEEKESLTENDQNKSLH